MAETRYLPDDSVLISTVEYAVLQRICGAAEAVAKLDVNTVGDALRLQRCLRVALSDYVREA